MARSIVAPGPGVSVPTQVAHPWKSVLRTVVAAAVGVALAWTVRVLGIDLASLDEAIIDSLTAIAWTVGTALAQWLLTRPNLMGLWRAIGLGTGVEKEPPLLLDDEYGDEAGIVDGVWIDADLSPPPAGYEPRHSA